MGALSWGGFGARFGFALLLVLSTYNPSGFSYIHWIRESIDAINPYIALTGILLVIGWVVYLRATFRSLGFIGVLLLAVLFGCIIWLLIDLGLLSLEQDAVFHWVILFLIAIVLTIGISWSHIRRRLSGQVDIVEGMDADD